MNISIFLFDDVKKNEKTCHETCRPHEHFACVYDCVLCVVWVCVGEGVGGRGGGKGWGEGVGGRGGGGGTEMHVYTYFQRRQGESEEER